MKEEDDSSDIGALWKEALDQYGKEAKLKPDLQRELSHQMNMNWSVSSILQEQDRQLDAFLRWRHSGGVVDKLRTAVSRNSAIIQSVSTQIGNAASSSFPPAAAIVTAFTYVMKASNDVSSDYDKVTAFFDIMSSLLERVFILEGRLPTVKTYKTIMMRVFSDLMVLCGIATFYVADGRFKKWLKALVSGGDDKLKSAYDVLERNIQKLESATLFATLSTTMETKSDVKDLNVITRQNLKVSIEVLSVTEQSLSVNMDTNLTAKEGAAASKELLKMWQEQKRREKETEKDDATRGSNKLKDSGAKKSATLNQVKRSFSSRAEPVVQFREIESSFVKGTFRWVEGDESYKSFLDENPHYLWIYGHRGLGKSYLAYSIILRLAESFGKRSRTAIAYFFFKEEHEELRSINSMLGSIIIQMAVADEKYRNEIAADLARNGDASTDDDGSQIWERFFVKKYPKGSDAKLFLVIDGLDEAHAESRDLLLKLLQQAKKDELNIQAVLTGRPEVNIEVEKLKPLTIEITKQKLSEKSGDLWHIIIDRCKALPKLRRLSPIIRKKIAFKLRHQADSVLYVEHMLRRLNAIGRENLIMKELEDLPSDLTALYALMLSDCERHRSKEQLLILKNLFAWLAYSKRPLKLGEASALVAIIENQLPFNLEEEIDGRSARLLLLTANNVDDEQSSDESDSELIDKPEEDDAVEDADDSIWTPLRFQERSLRQYFREDVTANETGLRSPPPLAHLMILRMAIRCLEISLDNNDRFDMMWYLQDYAADFWMQHFLDIKPDSIPERDVQEVVESLRKVFDPNGQILRNLEKHPSDSMSLFNDRKDNFLSSLQEWAERACNLPLEVMRSDLLAWLQEFSNSPKDIMAQVARGHISNWFTANESWDAQTSYKFAQNALLMTDIIPKLSDETEQNPSSQQAIMWVAYAFDDMPKASSAYRAIGMALGLENFYDAALLELKKSLQSCDSNIERFKTLKLISHIELDFSEDSDFKDYSEEHLGKSYEAINAALLLRPEVREDDKSAEGKNLRDLLKTALIHRAACEVKLGKIDQALSAIDEARKINKDSNIRDNTINDIIKAFEAKHEYEKIIFAVEKFNKWDRIGWLGWGPNEGHETFQHAAQKCDKKAFMIQTYEEVIRWMDEFNPGGDYYFEGARARLQLATAHQRVFVDYKEAKRLLYSILDGKRGGAPSAQDTIFTARLNLTDILMEEFRSNTNSQEKSRLHTEMRALTLRNHVVLGDDFEQYGSQTAIPMALMVRKLGPALEFQNGMEEIFRGCVAALKDNDSWNDNAAFRLLAKTLAWVPGLERDAQISVSLQFSCVDKDILKLQSQNAVEVDQAKVNLETRSTTTESNDPVTTSDNASHLPERFENTVEMPSESKESSKDEAEEDLLDNQGIFCNGCNRNFTCWNDGPVYICTICTDTDLCTECHSKLLASNHGAEWTEWRTFCGPHHRYIKGPIADFKGVKDRVIIIGEERTKFTAWLDGLNEKRWKEAWLRWWEKDDLVHDIL